MIGLNHGLSGAAITRFLPLPFALPLAFASHFLLDMMPHYGIDNFRRDHSKFWIVFFTVDALATLVLALYAVYNRLYAFFLGGLFATIPDYVWVVRVIKNISFNLSHHGHWFTHWHAHIQRYERPWGIFVEIPILIGLFYYVMIVLW